MIDINLIKNFHPKLKFGRNCGGRNGGKGGSVFIFSKNLNGNGNITVDGGKGKKGGKGGTVNIVAKNNKFKGKISAKGGDNNG